MKSSRGIRYIALLACALTVPGCTRAIDVPPASYEQAARIDDVHTIRTRAGDSYLARRFAVSDSTLIIDELSPDDGHDRARLPLTFPRSTIESIERMEHRPPLYVAVIGVGLFIAAIALLTGGDAFTD
ncbi:MAG TPA: hypothetical protein VF128_01315 [Gemmatimonadaceae bacterium]